MCCSCPGALGKVLPVMFAVLLRVQVAHPLGDFASAEIGAISMAKLEKFRENFIKINLSILLRWGFFQKEELAVT